ncbi:MAG: hypothetical protein J5636_02385 [Clostridiales bacterium]|nr:hypothetical protein [Clostridiales bacterium]
MKKRISVLLVLAMLLSMTTALASCSKAEETTKKKKTKKTKETVETTDPDLTDTEPSESPSKDIPTETPESSDDVVPTDTSDSSDASFGKDSEVSSMVEEQGTIVQIGPHEIPAYEYHQVTVEEQEIVNVDGLVIKVTGYSLQNGNARTFKMNIDNQTGHPIKLMNEMLRINGFEMSGFFYEELEDQTNTDVDFEFFMTLGTDIGDWDPRTVDMKFSVEYTDTEATFKTDVGSFQTSLAGEEVSYDFSYGATLFDDGTMNVTAIDYSTDSYGDGILLLYIENNRDTTMLFDREYIRVNGVELTTLIYSFVEPHSKKIESVYIRKSQLDELNIKDVKTIALTMMIREEDNFQDKIYGEPVIIKFD